MNNWQIKKFMKTHIERYLIIAMTTFLIIISIYLEINERGDSFSEDPEMIIILITTISLTAMWLIFKIFNFLNKDIYEIRTENYKLEEMMAESQKYAENKIKEVLQKNSEVLNIEKNIHKKIILNLENSLIEKLEQRFKKETESDYIIKSLTNELNPLTTNIEKYINNIQRNSIVNLIIGILGTLLIISILAITIISNEIYSNYQETIIRFLPRLTLIIFIQLFTFFFLRLYRNNLEDAKYFQNELTNLTARVSAIKISYILKNNDNLNEIIKEMASIERNFKLNINESLIGLEKSKIDLEFDKNILNNLKK